MKIEMKPIGFVSTDAEEIPRNWKVSDVEGDLIIDEIYKEGMREIEACQEIIVFFHFHKSPPFSEKFMRIKPPIYDRTVHPSWISNRNRVPGKTRIKIMKAAHEPCAFSSISIVPKERDVFENVKKKLLKDRRFRNRVNELSQKIIKSQPEA
jgi:hypothetical protein